MKKILLKHWHVILFFSFWTVYFALFWSKAIFFDESGNFWAGHVNIWGDWAAHFTMATAMSERGLFIHSPFLLGANFSYPFVADYISALLLNAGVPFIQAFTVPSFIFSMLIVAALYFFYKTLFSSRKIAIISTFIFLCNGGIGFYYFFQEIFYSSTPLTTFLNPAHEYTRIDPLGIRWISVIDSMIIPQRSFALGFSCALAALAMVYTIFFAQRSTAVKKWKLVIIGVLLGFLPILHTHSFLASFIFLSWWAILDLAILSHPKERLARFINWGVIGLTTCLIAVPLLKMYFANNVNSHFFSWLPGWMADEFKVNWLLFTWRNWGITPILAVIAWLLLYKKSSKKTVPLLVLPSFLIFILSNLFLFQPWSWDNTKLLVWFLLGSSGLIAYFFVRFYQSKWQKMLIIVLFFVVTASGMIDAYRIQRTDLHSYTEYSVTEIQLADWVKTNTDKNSIWLTGHPHNHWLFNLTGRQAVLAYPGWLWTQGYDYLPMQNDIQRMYDGEAFTKNLLDQYNVNYAVIGDNELFDLHANKSYFDANYPVVFHLGSTTIYKMK